MINAGIHTHIPDDIECYEGVELTIGKYCSIGARLKIYSGLHPVIENPECVSQFPFHEVWGADYPKCKAGGTVTIGNDVWIATDVSILEGITIGNGAIIGAGSVVTHDVLPYSFVAGNPARLISSRFELASIIDLQRISWWDWDEEKIKQATPDMKNINTFIKKYD